jgi:hypothetical protein
VDVGSTSTCPFAAPQVAGRVRYHTRLEELMFGMNYVAPPATDDEDGAEE